MNKLQENDIKLFYDTFRILLDYSNHRFHLDDKVDFLHDESLNPGLCKQAAGKMWDNPAMISELVSELSPSDVTDEQKQLIASWKNCVQDLFIIERHLKNGSILIGSNNYVYQVLGLNDSLEDLFFQFHQPTAVKATLLPFRDVIISDGLYEVLPLIIGSGIKNNLKNVYMQAKQDDQIIRTLTDSTQIIKTAKTAGTTETMEKQSVRAGSSDRKSEKKAAAGKKIRKPVFQYHLKVYPKGNGRSVYRIIDICGNATLAKLCETILDAFDFDYAHAYEFCMDNKMYGDDNYQSHPEYGERSVKVRLDQLHLLPGQKFSLHYDFGDDWMFVIHVASITEAVQQTLPKVIQSRGTIEQYQW